MDCDRHIVNELVNSLHAINILGYTVKKDYPDLFDSYITLLKASISVLEEKNFLVKRK